MDYSHFLQQGNTVHLHTLVLDLELNCFPFKKNNRKAQQNLLQNYHFHKAKFSEIFNFLVKKGSTSASLQPRTLLLLPAGILADNQIILLNTA